MAKKRNIAITEADLQKIRRIACKKYGNLGVEVSGEAIIIALDRFNPNFGDFANYVRSCMNKAYDNVRRSNGAIQVEVDKDSTPYLSGPVTITDGQGNVIRRFMPTAINKRKRTWEQMEVDSIKLGGMARCKI